MRSFILTGLLFLGLYVRQTVAQSITVTPDPCSYLYTPTPTAAVTPSPTITPSYELIRISEALVDPETGQNEWVELYNGGAAAVKLTNWQIDDIEGGGASPRTFSIDIPANSYAVYDLSSSIFNNDADDIRLLDPSGKVIDSFSYDFSVKGKTIGRTTDDVDEVCIQNPSKNSGNTDCISSATLTPTQISTVTPAKLSVLGVSTNGPTPIQQIAAVSAPAAKSNLLPVHEVQAAAPLSDSIGMTDIDTGAGDSSSSGLTLLPPLLSLALSAVTTGFLLGKIYFLPLSSSLST